MLFSVVNNDIDRKRRSKASLLVDCAHQSVFVVSSKSVSCGRSAAVDKRGTTTHAANEVSSSPRNSRPDSSGDKVGFANSMKFNGLMDLVIIYAFLVESD